MLEYRMLSKARQCGNSDFKEDNLRVSTKYKGILAACAIVAVASYLPNLANDPVATDQDCEDHWTSSSAAATCGGSSENPTGPGWLIFTSQYWVKAAGGWNCNIAVDCATDDHPSEQPISNDVVIGVSAFMELRNCDGTLTVGNC